MGRYRPPLYKLEAEITLIDKITAIDEQINELMIKRELYVKDLKQKVKAPADTEDKD